MSFIPNCKIKNIIPFAPHYHQFIEVTLSLPCGNRCEYCPQNLIPNEYYGHMIGEDFYKILENLKGSGVKRIDFSGMSEPFQHPACDQFMTMALNAGFDIICYTTGKGAKKENFDYLRKEVGNKYIEFHLTTINPEHPQRIGMTFEESENARKLFRENIKPPWVYRELRVGSGGWGNSISRSGNLGKEAIKVKPEIPIVCKKPWANVIMPNGDVITCCQDYKVENVFGNIYEQHYNEIKNSDKMKEFILKMSGVIRDDNLICRRCEHLWGTEQCY